MAKAQTFDVTIGTGTEVPGNTLYSPIYRFNATSTTRYNRSNILFEASELSAAGIQPGSTITALAFEKADTFATNANPLRLQILMANSSATPPLLTTTTWASIQSTHTAVYEDSNQVIPNTAGWVTIVFDVPFLYTGGSLEIATENQIDGTSPFSTGQFQWVYTSGFNNHIIGGVSTSASFLATLSSTTTAYKHRPNTRFTILPPAGVDPAISLPHLDTVSACTGDSVSIIVDLANFGSDTMTSVTIGWEINGVAQTSTTYNNPLASGDVVQVTLGTIAILPDSIYSINAYLTAFSPSGGNNTANDSASGSLKAGLAGTYTINAGAATGGTNFASFTDFASVVNASGICGAVTVNVVAGSGPYSEQVMLGQINGSSSINTITINGNGDTLTYLSANTSQRATLTLDGTDYITVDSLVIVAEGSATGEFGFAVQLMNSADYVTFNRSHFIADVTSTSTVNFAAFLAGPGTSPATSGMAANYLTLTNNTAIGGAYGIAIQGPASGTPAMGNVVINNTVRDFHSYGIYARGQDSLLIQGNDISRPNRTTSTTLYAMYLVNEQSATRVMGNRVHTLYGNSTGTSTVYGLYGTSVSADTNRVALIANNLFYGYDGNNSTTYGVFFTACDNIRLFHNTIYLDNVNHAGASVGRGIYISGSSTSDIELRNNIVNVSTGSTGIKHCIYFNTTVTNVVSNNNVLHLGATAGTNHIGRYSADFTTLADWQLANNGVFDQNSVAQDPLFENPASGNLTPSNPLIKSIGADLTAWVSVDFNGVVRPINPDPGAIEFVLPPGADPGLTDFPSLINLPPCDALPFGVDVTLVNFGADTLTAATIDWEVNGSAQTSVSWSGSLLPGESTIVSLGNFSFLAGVSYSVKAFISAAVPNNTNLANDTTEITSVVAGMAGVYTINAALPTALANFASFNDLVLALDSLGLCGPIVVNVVAGSGPYDEQVIIGVVKGSSALNTITINGNGDSLTFLSTTSAERATLKLNGTDYVTVNNLVVVARGSSTSSPIEYGFAVQLTNNADFNTFEGCTFIANQSTTSTNYAAFVAGSSATSFTTAGFAASNLTVNNCTTIGGNAGLVANGPTSGAASSGNVITNNTIIDYHQYGIYLRGQDSATVSGNDISRPSRTTATTTYPIYLINDMPATRITGNRIHTIHGAATTTSTVYGIYGTSTNGSTGREGLIANNLVYGYDGASGTTYGIFLTNSDHWKVYHNTINLDNVNHTGANVGRGVYISGTGTSNIDLRNNIISVSTGSTGIKHAIYFNTAVVNVVSDNNALHLGATSGTSHIGYYSGNFTTLADWQNASDSLYDHNSIVADPFFVNASGGDLTPANAAIDNIGANLFVDVAVDFFGSVRTTTPDPGAIEFVPPTQDIGMVEFMPLANYCSSDSTEVRGVVTNYGTAGVTDFPVVLEITGSASATYSIQYTDTLQPGQSDTITLAFVNTTGGGLFNLKAYTSLQGDANPANDTISVSNIKIDSTLSNPLLPAQLDFCVGVTTFYYYSHPNDIYWYDAQMNVVSIDTLSLVNVTNTDTFYAQAGGVTVESVGLTTTGTSGFISQALGWGLGFTVNQEVDIKDVTIYPSGSGTINILILDQATNAVLYTSLTTTIAGPGPVVVPVGATLQPGTYKMGMQSTGITSLIRESSGNAFPYTSPSGAVVITGGSTGTGAPTSGAYYWFYNWTLEVGYPCPSELVQMIVVPIPAPSVNLGPDIEFCTGDVVNVTLDAGNPGDNYLWSNGATSQTIQATTGGTFWVEVSNTFGCTDSDTVRLIENPLPTVNLGNDTAVCQGSSIFIILNASFPSATYQWQDGSTLASLIAMQPGSYHVTVTSNKGCSVADTITISVVPVPAVDLGPDTTVPQGQTITLDAGNPGMLYAWSTGATTQAIVVNVTGVYMVTVTSPDGCGDDMDTIEVTVLTGVELIGNAGSARIFPNPASEEANLLLELNQVGSFYIEVFDVTGRMVSSNMHQLSHGTHILPLQVNTLAQGTYMVRLRTSEGLLGVLPFVKQ